ncbi:TPA: hypothetical protein GF945_09595 [Escherichia coli]|nr:hypothetical protein [Escherichia coli]KUU39133.1 hypothetical protein AWF22_16985 [Escherichia coli]MCH6531536.1 hypothetical protein [Escherichia coli]MCH7222903.1 hypothetical protein [Escherichia coli]MDN1478911.1 hypothetical protein [Escherichia coli]
MFCARSTPRNGPDCRKGPEKNENNYHLQQESNLIYSDACYYVPAQVRRLPSFHTEASSNENQKYSRYLPCNIILQLPGI